jgi:DNA-binding response OmpR family regulator
VHLTRSELRLLALLTEEPGRVYTRTELTRCLWASDHVADGRVCESHVSNLRKKIDSDRSRPPRIVTVRGTGYVFR